MYRNRIIPCLLLKGKGLVKSVKFKDYNYIGDPLNAVKIFNDKGADELLFIDIEASKTGKIQFELLQKIANQSFMPLGYCGGINNFDDAAKIFKIGFEKICLNTAVLKKPELITELAKIYGNQSVIVCIDIKKDLLGRYKVYEHTTKKTKEDLIELVLNYEKLGAGEIILQSVDNDGTMKGYDNKLINLVSSKVKIPVVALGGAGCMNDIKEAIDNGASACAVGSMFVYYGKNKAVLINYPEEVDV
jgi:imidazole glycerol-phosphate synthase subunit HisF